MVKFKLVTYVSIFSNLSNIVLDYIFIFGVSEYIYPLGIDGAILATILGQCIQLICLSKIFLSFKMKKYRTNNLHSTSVILKNA